MIDLIKTKKNYIIALSLLFVFVSLSETTYSLFLHSETTSEFTYNTGILDLKFTEDEQLTLQNAFPMNDSEAIKLEPYILTIKNTGTLAYYFNLIMSSNAEESTINSNYIKYKVNDDMPSNLGYNNNTIYSNIIIYPNEELTFKINIWLDINTPNTELGKTFSAKVITSGTGIYKTLDASGANHPDLKDNMIPVYYDEKTSNWKIADRTNLKENYKWYNYNEGRWANSIKIKTSDKYIFDITRNNDLKINNITFNNGNAIIDENYLDINLSNYKYNSISNIIRIKFNSLNNSNQYIISNGKISYYYDNTNKKFVFKNNDNKVTSNTYALEENKWYIIGYTYDSHTVTFYLNGQNIGKATIAGSISSNESFKIGINQSNNEISKITIGNILIYNKILTNSEISKYYKTSVETIYDGLVCGYNEFIPMTLEEYYLSREVGTQINKDDILAFYVWIPRYKYKVWNITGQDNTDSYGAYQKGIDIVFEYNNQTTGTIYCENKTCYTNNTKLTEVTNKDNGSYYTHPAFSNSKEQLTGFWVSKYEVSFENNKVMSIPDENTWRNNYLSNYYEIIKNISVSNTYNVIKNTEWGAIAYLSHSKYGLCHSNKCDESDANSTYISGSNKLDSTTKNIYGVFDMTGGANEYTMANISNDNNLNLANTNFGSTPISSDDYDIYQNNTFILGDATKELSNNDISLINDNNWIIRGNISSNSLSRIFSYSLTQDIMSESITTRIVTK